jgi:hypothetical protein
MWTHGHWLTGVEQTRGVAAVSHVPFDCVQSLQAAPPEPHAVSRNPPSQKLLGSQHPEQFAALQLWPWQTPAIVHVAVGGQMLH